ncbi:hypothetical protein [Rhizobium tubonense]|uniref:Uncharacterized protein n=1 Tax=Rhizobium tubonense TaxID=484088 RepID=A0A2W4F1A8_9HYPH|nr:hypothetical protein [Rhizobium tubonense]PZM16073.1 hypothetical protein CPY51_05185 [Rhizobium tubonense]
MKSHPILVAYAASFAFTAGIFALSYWGLGDSGSVIFRKVLLAPVFLLAMRGLRTYFPQGNDDIRGVGTQTEFQFLTALTVSGFIMSVGPFEAVSIVKSLAIFLAMATFMTAWNMGFFLFDRRKPKQ